MIVHRPLSGWVTMLDLPPDGVARWDSRQQINFGDERADARGLPEFAAGWQRRAVLLDLGYHALGLGGGPIPGAVIELDNVAAPVRVTTTAAGIISRIEDDWPDASLSNAELAILASEDIVVRHALLARLATEGQPTPEVFHILPWELVDQVADEVTAMLRGDERTEHITLLGHWFTPAGSRLTAAIEQLDQGLRQQDPAMTWAAATALCTRVLDADVARLPSSTRQALIRLVAALREQNRFLGFTASRASRRLGGQDERGSPQLVALRLDSWLPAAADSSAGIRRESREAAREPFILRLAVTATGRAEVSLRASLPPDLTGWLAQSYGVPLQPITVTTANGRTRYLLPLAYAAGEISGRLSVIIPSTGPVEADLDGPLIGISEARYLSPAEVERSIRGLRTRSAKALWKELATMLPPVHPLQTVIARETR